MNLKFDLPGLDYNKIDNALQVWDFSSHLNALTESETQGAQGATSVFNQAPLVKFKHKDEGYAIDWNPIVPGRLISGTVRLYFIFILDLLVYLYFAYSLKEL